MSRTCPFRILGLNSAATLAEVTSRYRKLALQYHPDKNPGPAAVQQMAAINNARDAAVKMIKDSEVWLEPKSEQQPSRNSTWSNGRSPYAGFTSYPSHWQPRTRTQRETESEREVREARAKWAREAEEEAAARRRAKANRPKPRHDPNDQWFYPRKPKQPVPDNEPEVTAEDIRKHEEHLNRIYADNERRARAASEEKEQQRKAKEQAYHQARYDPRSHWSYNTREAQEDAEQRAAAEKLYADRLAELKKQAQAEAAEAAKMKKEEEARVAAEREAARIAEEIRLEKEARRAEEARRRDDIRRAEEQLLAEEAKHLEEVRLAEEARHVEEARLAQEAYYAQQQRDIDEALRMEEIYQQEQANLAQQERIRKEAIEKQRHRREGKVRARRAQIASALAQATRERQRRLDRQQQEMEVLKSTQHKTPQPPRTPVVKHRVSDDDVGRNTTQSKRQVHGSKVLEQTAQRLLNEFQTKRVFYQATQFWDATSVPIDVYKSASFNSGTFNTGTINSHGFIHAGFPPGTSYRHSNQGSYNFAPPYNDRNPYFPAADNPPPSKSFGNSWPHYPAYSQIGGLDGVCDMDGDVLMTS